MIRIFLLLLLPFLLYGAKILNYNVYDRTDRVDIMITFDTPYNGVIKQNTTKAKLILTLDNVTIEAPKYKKIASKYLQALSIVPLKNSTQIIAAVPSHAIKLHVSKTTDGYGLRLRFTTETATRKKELQQTNQDPLAALPTKKGNDLTKSYYIVIAILVAGIFFLFYIKRKIDPKQKAALKAPKKKENWLFQSTNTPPATDETKSPNSVTIRFQKAIDSENSVIMLDFGPQSYLVLMGKSNILLDKFTDEKPTSQHEFESILQSRNEELESFLTTHEDEKVKQVNTKSQEPLQAYKERAATLLYSDNQE
jgi:hypothetical protein